MGVFELYRKMQAVDKRGLIMQSVKNQSSLIIKLNKNQLLHGKSADGSNLSPSYSWDWYAKEKQQQNPLPPFGVPDLKRTGSFYAKKEVVFKGVTNFFIPSKDSKADKLTKKYGQGINDLSKESMQAAKTPITNEFLKLWVNAISK